MKALLADACFLIAVYDETDKFSASATSMFREYFANSGTMLLLPWPIMYESISTRMVRNRKRMTNLRKDWSRLDRRGQIRLIDDGPYRSVSLDECFDETLRDVRSYRTLSLADRVIRSILADTNMRVDGFITFNHGDFSDVCTKHRREMVYASSPNS